EAAEEGGRAVFREAEHAPVGIGDRTRVRQVLANLVDNAVKYTPAGGRVTIAAVRKGDEAVVTVTDTGPGISADDLPRIWERLYRGDRSRTTRGLGLGLSLVKAIVEAHGGRVAAQSPAGGGARLEVRLPIVNSQMSAM
ncbi:MAG: sensor histidine kinase, partial [Luteitalea sp.]